MVLVSSGLGLIESNLQTEISLEFGRVSSAEVMSYQFYIKTVV